MRTTLPSPLAITMGDPAGIGPEIVASAFARGLAAGCFVVGDLAVMQRASRLVDGLQALARIKRPGDVANLPPNCVPVLVPAGLPEGLADLPWGVVDARAGAAAAACIECAASLAMTGEVAGIVTAPLHKEALSAAGVDFPGHTEMLQSLAAGGGPLPPVRMMLANEQLRTVLVTIHMSLRRAIDAVTQAAVLETLRIAHAFGQRLPGVSAAWGGKARIAVAGLNPHAGEGGLFGDEEITVIGPAIRAAQAEGIDAHGPFAPDTVFMRARHAPPDHPGEFDIVVAMTHDHGLIPVKYLGVEDGVNVTLGLPFVRTSPDHGTAFDIAGRGVADPRSLGAAIRMARSLA